MFRLTKAKVLIATGLTASAYYYLNTKQKLPILNSKPNDFYLPPTRETQVNRLKQETFDILVIGGGATGSGIALDAATRGLKVALVEENDYSSGTSSKSTKLVHGGVRYLEKAFLELDYEQYKLVQEALNERSIFLHIAPHLSSQLPIMVPIYSYWKLPYYWAGSKAYDVVAGRKGLESSYFISKSKALDNFPMLNDDNLKGAMVYYDGQQNDSRMNISLILTAVLYGAVCLNHAQVTSLSKTDGKVSGAVVRVDGEEVQVKSKVVVNATGPFIDCVREMDGQTNPLVQPSAGVHITLPSYYSPATMGLLDPQTSDGRVIFFLPWESNTIAGTTDTPTKIQHNLIPDEKDVQWILKEVQEYLSDDLHVRRGDVLSAWSGIRPLIRDPNAKNTAALVRNHMIHTSESGLITIAGGKWTTYRSMSEETVDKAIEVGKLQAGKCVTPYIQLIGAHGWSKTLFVKLIQQAGLATDVAQHLAHNYGDRAWAVAALTEPTGSRWPLFGRRLSELYPFIEAEIRYAVQAEYAMTAIDVIARRQRIAFLNANVALDTLPRVIEIMAHELHWSVDRKKQEYEQAVEFLKSMGLRDSPTPHYSRANFTTQEILELRGLFAQKDLNGDGLVSVDAAREIVKSLGWKVEENAWRGLEDVEFHLFLDKVANRRGDGLGGDQGEAGKVYVERSGGGV